MLVRPVIAGLVAAVLGLGLVLGAETARAADPDFLTLSAGVFDIRRDERAAEFRLEYRSKLQWWIFTPFTGVMATSDRAFYGYGGLLLDIYLGRRFVITPSLAAGLFDEGDGKDLGHKIEFRSQIEVAYRLDDRSRLAISFNHVSNASIGDRNPGEESLMFTYAIPFDRILGR